MMKLQVARRTARSKLIEAVNIDHRFPENVFASEWSDFFFFDSDWMFEAAFVKRVQSLLLVEGAACACLANLDSLADQSSERLIFIEPVTTEDAYRLLLRGTAPGTGWIDDVDRFGCISNGGQWCIYADKSAEIGVIGFQQGSSAEKHIASVPELNATRIAEAIAAPLSFGFSAEALSPRWRADLVRNYGA